MALIRDCMVYCNRMLIRHVGPDFAKSAALGSVFSLAMNSSSVQALSIRFPYGFFCFIRHRRIPPVKWVVWKS